MKQRLPAIEMQVPVIVSNGFSAPKGAIDPPDVFIGGSKLDDLAELANAAHRACEQAVRSALIHAKDCGETLVEAKRQVGHGHFLAWLAKHCEFSARQAERYARIFRMGHACAAVRRPVAATAQPGKFVARVEFGN